MSLRRAVRLAAGVLAALALWHLSGIGPDRAHLVVNDLALVASSALATALLWRCARSYGEGPVAVRTLLFAAAALCWTAASVGRVVYEVVLDRDLPTISFVDVFYTASLGLVVVACLLLLRTVVSAAAVVRTMLDGFILAVSAIWVLWWALLRTEHGNFLWLYPALDTTAACLAAMVMVQRPRRDRLPWWLVSGSMLLLAVGDSTWAYRVATGGQVGGHLMALVWIAGYLGVGFSPLADRRPSQPIERRVNSRWELLLPYPLALVAFLIGSVDYDAVSGWAALPLVALVLAVISRQIVSLWENHQWARTLEARVDERTAELREREQHFRSIVQAISDVVVVIGRDGINEVSPSVTAVLGYQPADVIGRPMSDLVHPDDLRRLKPGEHTKVFHHPGAAGSSSMRVLRADGTWCPMDARYSNLGADSALGGVLVTFRDVTERHAFEEQLRQQAHHDELTGLANRRHLHAALEQALVAGQSPSLVLLDLDDFKAVNDTSGHQLGDHLLMAVADRLRRCIRPGDLVARLGGDEFAVLVVHDPGAAVATTVARRLIDDLSLALRVDGQDVRCAGSAGVAGRRDSTVAAADLLRDADVAMYVAKRRGKSRFEVFTDDMHRDVVRRQMIEVQLRAAVDDGRLLLEYQPIVELASGRVIGAEALVRLPLPDGTVLPPAEFIPIAEDIGLIGSLGGWVLRRACADAAAWQVFRPDGPPLSVSVNVAIRQLQDRGLDALVREALDRAELAEQLLTLEITEGALTVGHDEVEAELHALRALGIRLSVDDFGAGYSSLGRLQALPVDELKIDRSFVAELDAGTEAPLVGVMLAMADRMRLAVVAEGIESAAQAAALLRRGCHAAQGFFFARPQPAPAMAEWADATFLIVDDSTSLVEPI
ncbi:MAG: EAL domain-containing protein [Acidobacteria bacterium]|nr:EAL domain-containing protein [Acidobacteriota bacterium]